MSRASQFFWYLNAEKVPTQAEEKVYYTDLSITEAVKAARRRFKAQEREGTANGIHTSEDPEDHSLLDP